MIGNHIQALFEGFKDINHFHGLEGCNLVERQFAFQNFGNGDRLVNGLSHGL